MGKPPQLSADQRSAALAKAKESRQIRSIAKSKIKSGELSLSDIFTMAQSDPVIAKMRVAELLAALSGVGKIRANAIMERLNISPTRRIQGLGKHQLSALTDEFSPTTSRGKLIVLSGPGGVGKSTIAAYIRKHGTFWVSVSSTTRKPRTSEHHGIEYYFLSDEEFDGEIDVQVIMKNRTIIMRNFKLSTLHSSWETFAFRQKGIAITTKYHIRLVETM
jgi:guanylate kinase